MLLSIKGISFVLHQIRHMIGTALAVAHGALPPDAVQLGLASSLQVHAAGRRQAPGFRLY